MQLVAHYVDRYAVISNNECSTAGGGGGGGVSISARRNVLRFLVLGTNGAPAVLTTSSCYYVTACGVVATTTPNSGTRRALTGVK